MSVSDSPSGSGSATSSVPSACTKWRGPPALWPIASSTRRATSSPSSVSCSSRLRATASRPARCSDEDLAGAVLLVAQDPLDLFVDHACGLVGVVAGVHEVLTEEDGALRSPGHRPDAVGHAPLAHHLAGQLGAADEVVLRARGQVPVHQLLGDAPAEAHHERVGDVLLLVDVALLDRELLGDTERHARGQDRHLVHRVGVLEHVGEHRVAALVVGDHLLLLLAERHRLALEAHEHPVAGRLEVLGVHLVGAAAHREQRGLVHEVGEVGARHARRAPCDDVDVDVVGDLLVAEVHLEDRDPLVLGGERHHDLAVETARAEECGVEHVGAVGRGHHHDALGGLEPVHLGEHLVERLLALVVAAAEAGAALAADRVDLVDEDDRRRLLLRGLEEVAHTRRADPDEHLHEVGAGDRHERHSRLTRDRAGDEGLAGAGRADEQHALRDARADLLELARVLEEVDDLGDLLLDRAVAGDVGEHRLRLLGVVDLRPTAPDVHHRAHLALRCAGSSRPARRSAAGTAARR